MSDLDQIQLLCFQSYTPGHDAGVVVTSSIPKYMNRLRPHQLLRQHCVCRQAVTSSYRQPFRTPKVAMSSHANGSASTGDLNNTTAARPTVEIVPDSAYMYSSLAIPESEDDEQIRESYRPFLRNEMTSSRDWIDDLELSTVTKMAEQDLKNTGERLKVLVLFGSLRKR